MLKNNQNFETAIQKYFIKRIKSTKAFEFIVRLSEKDAENITFLEFFDNCSENLNENEYFYIILSAIISNTKALKTYAKNLETIFWNSILIILMI